MTMRWIGLLFPGLVCAAGPRYLGDGELTTGGSFGGGVTAGRVTSAWRPGWSEKPWGNSLRLFSGRLVRNPSNPLPYHLRPVACSRAEGGHWFRSRSMTTGPGWALTHAPMWA